MSKKDDAATIITSLQTKIGLVSSNESGYRSAVSTLKSVHQAFDDSNGLSGDGVPREDGYSPSDDNKTNALSQLAAITVKIDHVNANESGFIAASDLLEASEKAYDYANILGVRPSLRVEAFSFTEQTGISTIDHLAGTISIEVVALTNISALIPTIALDSTSATVSPLSGVVNDFTNPVIYTVSEGALIYTKEYVVTVTVAI